jgi:hypothetical protein
MIIPLPLAIAVTTGGVSIWRALPKTQKCIVTLCYRPCDDNPTAPRHGCNDRWSIDMAVYRKGEYGNIKEYFFKLVAILYLM